MEGRSGGASSPLGSADRHSPVLGGTCGILFCWWVFRDDVRCVTIQLAVCTFVARNNAAFSRFSARQQVQRTAAGLL